MQSENFIWQLIARSLNGEASYEEIILLDEHLNNNKPLQQQYDILKRFWHCSSADISAETETSKHLARIFERAAKANAANNIRQYKKRILTHRKIFAVSFAGLAIITVAIAFFYPGKINGKIATSFAANNNIHQLIAQNGKRSRTVLPDGSVVWLNAGSVLTYDNFSSKTRQVYLKGEAFFDVVKDASHPFIVHANSVDIKVLGTAFNVKSYTEDNKVEATLIRGIIQVTRQDKTNGQPVFLHPNEKLVIDLKESTLADKQKPVHTISEPVFTVYHLDSTVKTENLVETSWVYNKLEFRGDNFEELAKKLERWYNIKIFFEDENVKKLNFNGSFKNETTEQAFEALKAAVPFDYAIKDNEIFISSSKKNLP